MAVTVALSGIREVPVAMIAHRAATSFPTTCLPPAPLMTLGHFLIIHPHKSARLPLSTPIQIVNRNSFPGATLDPCHYKRALAINPLNGRQTSSL
jgi:hypothetical protein